jgi:ribosomal-protein-alanine N-acetyltransferase
MLELNFKPFPVLTTQRLTLRQLRKSHKDDVFVLRSDKETMQYIPRPVATKKEDAVELIDKMDDLLHKTEAINWAITLTGNNQVIGIIGFYRIANEHYRGEVGYILHPQFRGKGIMHEALVKVLDFGFNVIKFHTIEAVVNPLNTSSAKLLEKNGFTKSAHFKEREFFNGKFIDSVFYQLLTPEG